VLAAVDEVIHHELVHLSIAPGDIASSPMSCHCHPASCVTSPSASRVVPDDDMYRDARRWQSQNHGA